MSNKFPQPYFVTPHAVDRFQKRVCNIARNRVIMEIQHALQCPFRVVEKDWKSEYKIYACTYRYGDGTAKPYYAAVGEGHNRKDGPTWPAVVTIKGTGSVIHGKLCGNDDLTRKKGVAVIVPEMGAMRAKL